MKIEVPARPRPFLLIALLGTLTGAAAQSARLVTFEKDGHWGYRARNGQVVIKPHFSIANPFSPEGIAAVVDETGWAYIDRSGKVVIRPYVFDNGPDYFAEGLARFVVDGKFGFFDKYGRVMVHPTFSFAHPFSDARAAVCEGCSEVVEGEHRQVEGGRWGYIDRAGKLVIPLQFEEAGRFEKGTARVRIGGEYRQIDRSGRLVRIAP